MLKRYTFSLLLFLTILSVKAQDTQFSQFYANPMYQNPAFAGSSLMNRVVLNYRYQWPNLNANYMSYSVSYDKFLERYNSGIGVQVLNDHQGVGGLNSLDAGLRYAYQLRLTEKFSFRGGLQLSYVQRSVDYSSLTFGTQYDAASQSFVLPSGENFSTTVRRYADFSAGGLLFSDQFYFGFTANHLTCPNQSLGGVTDRLPIKFTAQAGWKIPLDFETKKGLAENITDGEKSFTPAILYKQQGNFQQLDLGVYLTYEPIVLGVWYRGLPIIQSVSGINNHDALAALVGYKWQGLSIGYSYDVTVSKLSTSSGGSHEISIIYEWANIKKPHVPRKAKYTPCPRF